MAGARIFGVISGSDEGLRVAYLKPSVRVSEHVLAKLGSIAPTQVFRFAATCEKSCCSHFDGNRCQLGKRVAEQLPQVVDELPPCQIRATCRWFSEQGKEVCFRCPQISTRVSTADPVSYIALTPIIAARSGDRELAATEPTTDFDPDSQDEPYADDERDASF